MWKQRLVTEGCAISLASIPWQRGKNFMTNMSELLSASVLKGNRSKSWRSPFGPVIVALSAPVYEQIIVHSENNNLIIFYKYVTASCYFNKNNNNNNTNAITNGTVIMTLDIVRVHVVHVMNADNYHHLTHFAIPCTESGRQSRPMHYSTGGIWYH